MKKRVLIVVSLLLVISMLVLTGCGAGGSDGGYDYDADGEGDDGYYDLSDEYPSGSYDSDYYAPGTESYLAIRENAEKYTGEDSLVTFSLKVDTASYTNVQRFIENGERPPADAVRIEEMINFFNYDAEPTYRDGPFSIYTEIGQSPLDASKYMAFVRVKTDDIDKDELPSSNLTFLIDTSGSMYSYDKLPLLQQAFAMLVETLDADDVVSIVTYAGSSRVVLDSVSGADKDRILRAIDGLQASGSTAGADGIKTAYKLAEKNYMPGGNNRVILATDGDFNVGISNTSALSDFISDKRDSGVYLSVLGFGTGNIRDDIMETLAKDGNGNYSYINSLSTAQKVLVEELASNLFVVAEDVKAQVEFNPANVSGFRLIGYENRKLNNEDFTDDTKDAGEIGAGTDVVLMFEISLVGNDDGLKYSNSPPSSGSGSYPNELFELRIAYKEPGASTSNYLKLPVTYSAIKTRNSSDFSFACSVAAFGHILRGSEHTADATLDNCIELAEGSLGRDKGGYRRDYLEMLYDYSTMRRYY